MIVHRTDSQQGHVIGATHPKHDGSHENELRRSGSGGGQPSLAWRAHPATVEEQQRQGAADGDDTQRCCKNQHGTDTAVLQTKAVTVAKLAHVVGLGCIESQQEEGAEGDGHACGQSAVSAANAGQPA